MLREPERVLPHNVSINFISMRIRKFKDCRFHQCYMQTYKKLKQQEIYKNWNYSVMDVYKHAGMDAAQYIHAHFKSDT